MPPQPDQLRCRHDRHDNGERATPLYVSSVSSISDNNKIVTLEGLGTPEKPHPVQRAFIEEQAVQCGYCINGMIMQSAAFLVTNPRPSDADIKKALAANLCRCGTHARIVRAVQRAADLVQGRQ
jgi:nicotinate dehydrogenase subunit A